MAETDTHRELMVALIQSLKAFYANDPMVYVSGNLLLFYIPGDRRRHLSPDVFVVKGVPDRLRDNYLVWEEGKAPDLVIEFTSSSTRHEDIKKKYRLYEQELKVAEYFLFDPREDYLEPPLQGYRLSRGQYVPVKPVKGRLPSRVLGLHLERQGPDLRLYDPAMGQWLPTLEERVARAEAETEQLRRELAELRRRSPDHS
jgi:Uma2 family endonuclease